MVIEAKLKNVILLIHTNISVKELIEQYPDLNKNDIETMLFQILLSDEDYSITLSSFGSQYPEVYLIINDLASSLNKIADSIGLYENYKLSRLEYIDNFSVLVGYGVNS